MGQKVHPYGFRIGTLYGWHSNWYADKHYAQQLHEDLAVRKFIKKKLFHAGISKIVIDRTGEKMVVNIHAARPGILIGKRGAEVDVLRVELKEFTDCDIFINVREIRKAELDAKPVAEAIALQPERRVAFGGGDQHGPRACHPEAVIRMVVAVAEEDTVVVGIAVATKMIDQARAGRSLAAQPRQLGSDRMRLFEDLRRPPTEHVDVAFPADRKPPDRDAVHPLDTGVELVAPRDVVGRAGRQDLDLDVSGEVLSDIPGMLLGAAVQLGAIALDDNGELHCSSVRASRQRGVSI